MVKNLLLLIVSNQTKRTYRKSTIIKRFSRTKKYNNEGHFKAGLAGVKWTQKGESPGLVVMGGDSCYKGCEFKSQDRILEGHFSH